MAESPSIKTISNFKSVLKGGGARPNLFEVQIPEFPAYVTKDTETIRISPSFVRQRNFQHRTSLQSTFPSGVAP